MAAKWQRSGSTLLIVAAAACLALPFWGQKAGAGTAAVPSSVSRSKAARAAVAAQRKLSQAAGRVDAGVFAGENWMNQPEGTPRPPRKAPGIQDLTSPEWAGRQAFKDLKAMAVFEAEDSMIEAPLVQAPLPNSETR